MVGILLYGMLYYGMVWYIFMLSINTDPVMQTDIPAVFVFNMSFLSSC